MMFLISAILVPSVYGAADTASIENDTVWWIRNWNKPEAFDKYSPYYTPSKLWYREQSEFWRKTIQDLAVMGEAKRGPNYNKPDKIYGGYPRPKPIKDNSEGIQGYHSILVKQRDFEDCEDLRMALNATIELNDEPLWVDTGAGKFDNIAKILNGVTDGKVDLARLDPYNLEPEVQMDSLQRIYHNGGADVAFSMSVLNVISDPLERREHIDFLHTILKNGGIAVFKVWAGWGDIRGIGMPMRMLSEGGNGRKRVLRPQGSNPHGNRTKNEGSQNNKFACEYLDEIKEVFGDDTVFLVDSKDDLKSQNLIYAIKKDYYGQNGFCHVEFADVIGSMHDSANASRPKYNQYKDDRFRELVGEFYQTPEIQQKDEL